MRILVAGVNYPPEVTGIGPYTAGVGEHLALQGHEVVVATTFPFAPLWRWFEPPHRWQTRERMNGVDVWRTKVMLPPRRTAVWRVAFDSSIGLTSVLTALSIPRVDVAICLSPPIQATLAAAAVRFKVGKLVILVQDLPAEAAHSVGMLNNGVALRVGRSLQHLAYKLADRVVWLARRSDKTWRRREYGNVVAAADLLKEDEHIRGMRPGFYFYRSPTVVTGLHSWCTSGAL